MAHEAAQIAGTRQFSYKKDKRAHTKCQFCGGNKHAADSPEERKSLAEHTIKLVRFATNFIT